MSEFMYWCAVVAIAIVFGTFLYFWLKAVDKENEEETPVAHTREPIPKWVGSGGDLGVYPLQIINLSVAILHYNLALLGASPFALAVLCLWLVALTYLFYNGASGLSITLFAIAFPGGWWLGDPDELLIMALGAIVGQIAICAIAEFKMNKKIIHGVFEGVEYGTPNERFDALLRPLLLACLAILIGFVLHWLFKQ